MPEIVAGQKAFSLLEVCRSLEKTITNRYGSEFWVKAEINKLNHYPHSGHAYPELVEKKNGVVQAEMRSVIWGTNFNSINDRFKQLLGEPIKDGIEVLLLASLDYNAKYGLSLHISDIDVSYTLGELQKEKQESINRLKKEGLFEANRKKRLALLPKRIALISVETSKGYADFLKVIDQNEFGYRFFHMLFPALLQGDRAVASIGNQLKRIAKVKHHFDAVCIIRGGGGDVGLSTFNNYELAKAVASFPLPVFSGIGHSTNETVTEMVSFRYAITPTELGDFFIQRFHNFSVPIQDALKLLKNKPKQILIEENHRFLQNIKSLRYELKAKMRHSKTSLNTTLSEFQHLSKSRLRKDANGILNLAEQLSRGSKSILNTASKSAQEQMEDLSKAYQRFQDSAKLDLQNKERFIKISDPINTLKLGYSITKLNGRLIKNSEDLKLGDQIENTFASGTAISEVKFKKNGK